MPLWLQVRQTSASCFHFVLFPGELPELGDRVSIPGRGMFFHCYLVHIHCGGGGRGYMSLYFVVSWYPRIFQGVGKTAVLYISKSEIEVLIKQPCELVNLYRVGVNKR